MNSVPKNKMTSTSSHKGESVEPTTGVVDTEVGYAGGTKENPTWHMRGDHAETLELTIDESETSLINVLEHFFKIHDPTTLNKQGNDIGRGYRSAFFYQSDEEKSQVQDFINMVDKSGVWKKPISTSLEKLDIFYPAEEYHQDYLQKNPRGYTCHFERNINFN